MNKIFKVLLASFLITSFTSCDISADSQSNSEHHSSIPKEEINDMAQRKIYDLAVISGYSDTYNKWIDAIKANDIELTIIENAIQWKYTTFSTWTKLINLDDLKEFIGETNKNLQFRVLNGNLEYKCTDVNTEDWKILALMCSTSINDTITITFNPENGAPCFTQPVKPGEKIATPEELIYEGYEFKGWYVEGLEEEWKFDYNKTFEDITLLAKWKTLNPFVPIDVWVTYSEEKVVEEIVEEWNNTHDVEKFKINFRIVGESDCGLSMSKDPTINGAPALFLTSDGYISSLVEKNVICEIKDEAKYNVETNNLEVSLVSVTQQDKVWGYPITADESYFLWYNNSLVDADKIDSLEELLAYAKETGKTVMMNPSNGFYAYSFLMSPQACGTDSLKWEKVSGQNIYETTWDSDVGIKVSEYISNLLSTYYADGTLVTEYDVDMISEFANGTLMAAVGNSWSQFDLINAIGEENLSAYKLPEYHIDGQAYQMSSMFSSKVYCINKTKPENEQYTAMALAELLTSKEAQLKRFELRGTLPCNLQALEDPRFIENVSICGAALIKQSQFGANHARCVEVSYYEVGTTIGQAYLDNLSGKIIWSEFLKEQMDILRNN